MTLTQEHQKAGLWTQGVNGKLYLYKGDCLCSITIKTQKELHEEAERFKKHNTKKVESITTIPHEVTFV